jgi:hypothetical protein
MYKGVEVKPGCNIFVDDNLNLCMLKKLIEWNNSILDE